MFSSIDVLRRSVGGLFSLPMVGAWPSTFLSSTSGGLPSCDAGRLRCPPRLLAFRGMAGADCADGSWVFSLNGCDSASFAALRLRFLNGQKGMMKAPALNYARRIPSANSRMESREGATR